MGIELVEDDDNAFCLGKELVYESLHPSGGLKLCAPLRHHHLALPQKRCKHPEYIGCAISDVLEIETCELSRFGWYDLTRVPGKVTATFVNADNWKFRIEWAFVDIQNIFHMSDEPSTRLRWNTPN